DPSAAVSRFAAVDVRQIPSQVVVEIPLSFGTTTPPLIGSMTSPESLLTAIRTAYQDCSYLTGFDFKGRLEGFGGTANDLTADVEYQTAAVAGLELELIARV
ncbi:hypothetical protein, partial [Pseudomonas aeruginosa]|uniref:hypothetical protein n=1 Tax=Pseudomonas aeruginosa TaxID=287 RepID=UPI001EEEC9FD